MLVNIIQPQGYFVSYSERFNTPKINHHLFCGAHAILGGKCPNCNKPLLLFLTIDLNDKRFLFRDIPLKRLSLLFCWSCNISQGTFFYQFINEGKIKILEYNKGGAEDNFPYADYPEFFPERYVSLQEVTTYEQRIIAKLNREELDEFIDLSDDNRYLGNPQHQIGGEPYLIQKELDKIRCYSCNRVMPFFAAIADNCADDRGFVGNDQVQVIFYLCKKCLIVGAVQRCE